MNKKCIGCGSILQNTDKLKEGYTVKDINEVSYCERCFKLINYGEIRDITDKKEEFLKFYKSINNTNDLVLFLVDIFNINDTINLINEYIDNNIILVITKKDILAASLKEEKIKKFIDKYNFNKNIIDFCIISSRKNYNFDLLFEKINKYKTSKDVYVVGNTNAGKSTFINKVLYNYSNNNDHLAVSYKPSTTLNVNKIKINDDLFLIDTPGIIDDGAIYDKVDNSLLRKITPKKTIKPRTYQLEEGNSIYANEVFRLEYVKGEKNSFTIFISNDIIIDRINTITNNRGKELELHELIVSPKSDVMINGLCFIKVVKQAKINLYTINGAEITIRNSLI